ncbi:lymphocyte antigen 75 [Discoglossus pictus]
MVQNCYQYYTHSSLTWKQAYMSCQSQEAELLSISSAEELKYIIGNEELPDKMWMGLNRLDVSGGWQWSDNTPLNFINWDDEVTGFSHLDDTSCGVLLVEKGQWKNYRCETALPYICKKIISDTKYNRSDSWRYFETECEQNWLPYNGFCHQLYQPSTWEDADLACKKQNGNLISMHSLADIELSVTQFNNGTEDIWSGFKNEDSPALFSWSDGTETHFTYWDQNEPTVFFNKTPNCVSFSGKSGHWRVRSCNEKLAYICQKNGVKNGNGTDILCQPDQESRRHGDYCYTVNQTEVAFGSKCDLVITNRFEQEFINTLIKENSKVGQYFWTSLRDANKTGDYYWETSDGRRDMTYSDWGPFQPASSGGCVAMANGKFLGKWEVKDCKTFKAKLICKKIIKSSKPEAPTQPTVPPKIECPQGWHSGSDLFCYKLFHFEKLLNKRTWEEAEGFCEEFGGHLSSFAHTEDLNNFYTFLTSKFRDRRWIWVGLHKRNLALEGSWQWSDDRPVSSVVLPPDFQDENYDLKDCAAFKVNQPQTRRHGLFIFREEKEQEFYLKPFRCDAALEFVCQIPKGAELKIPEWYIPDPESELASLFVDGEEFWFVNNTRLSYKEAELYCANNGSELASVESWMAMTAIQGRLKNISGEKQKWWVRSLDFRDRILSSMRLFHMTFQSSDHCWHFSASDKFYSSNIFVDKDCNQKLPFVCEYRNISLYENTTETATKYKGACPSNWFSFGNKCFLQVRTLNVTFSKAVEQCKTYGATLPSIASQLEQDFLTTLFPKLTSQFWIGLKLSLNEHVTHWIDDSEMKYTNFNPLLQGRLKKFSLDVLDDEKNKQCVFILNNPKSAFIGTWDFTECSDSKNVTLCQKYQENKTKLTVNEDEEYEGQKYKIVLQNMTWYNASIECRRHQMELVSITDQYQLAFLAVRAGLLNHPMWIGLSSRDDGVHYRWQDGKDVTLNRWAQDDQAKDECVFMDSDGSWYTLSCDTELPGAFCQLPSNKTEEKPFENTKLCPHRIKDMPWVPFRNSCYAFLISHKRWLSLEASTARAVCRDLHPDAYVLSIRDEDENAFVFDQLQPYSALANWVWLGIVYDTTEKRLRWHDETYVKYSNWRHGRPDVGNNSFYAGMNIDGSWDIFPNLKYFQTMFLQHYSIVSCKIELDIQPEHTLPLLPMHYENLIYYIIPKKLSWDQAVRECRQTGSNLASVHDDIQQLFLESIVRHDGFPLWIGLSSHDVSQTVFEWSDGSMYNYMPPHFKQLNRNGNCVYLDTKAEWRYKNCTDVLDGAICYKYKEEQNKNTDHVCPYTPGEGKWILHKDFCYAFDMKIYNYSVFTSDEAKTFCQKLDPNAVLLTINDENENDFVSKHLATDTFITNRVWLGVSPRTNDKEIKWMDGSDLKYTNWNGLSKEASGSCAILLPTEGKWTKIDCMSGHGRIVCKAPLKSNKTGLAIGFAVLIIVILLVGLLFYIYKKQRAYFSSSVRYQRTQDETESMVVNY